MLHSKTLAKKEKQYSWDKLESPGSLLVLIQPGGNFDSVRPAECRAVILQQAYLEFKALESFS